jgi:hypothetical protein
MGRKEKLFSILFTRGLIALIEDFMKPKDLHASLSFFD